MMFHLEVLGFILSSDAVEFVIAFMDIYELVLELLPKGFSTEAFDKSNVNTKWKYFAWETFAFYYE